MAATTVLRLAVLKAIRAVPRPLKESVPALLLAVETRVQVFSEPEKRRMPRPK
jgi:hypothetical protein